MHIVVKRSHQATKIIKRNEMRKHRKYHIAKAQEIREQAEQWKEMVLKSAEDLHLGERAKEEVEAAYTSMLSEAIAEENSKCMDRKH